MSAQPASDDYVPSPSPRIPFRRPAKVISLPHTRSDSRPAPPLPESNQEQTDQNGPAFSGADSGTRVALRDEVGDWASITTVWTDSPQPLRELAAQVGAARDSEHATAIAMACWALLVLIPRGLLHLASWVLAHPVRSLAAAAVVAVFIATL